MNCNQFFVNDIGIVLRWTFIDCKKDPVDLTGATVQFKFKRPDATTFTRNAVLTGNPGEAEYTTISGDLNQAGDWEAHGFLSNAGGFTGHSKILKFEVEAPIS